MSARKVTIARLHTPVYIAGLGELKTPITATKGGAGVFKELSMTYDGQTLVFTVNGTHEAGTPSANVVSMMFEKEAPKTK